MATIYDYHGPGDAYADEWYIIGHDDTGGLISVDCQCPKCNSTFSTTCFISAESYDVIEAAAFQIECKCEFCHENIFVECDDDNCK